MVFFRFRMVLGVLEIVVGPAHRGGRFGNTVSENHEVSPLLNFFAPPPKIPTLPKLFAAGGRRGKPRRVGAGEGFLR